jgi:hypothetical protein
VDFRTRFTDTITKHAASHRDLSEQPGIQVF